MALESDGTVTPTGTGAVPNPPESVTVEQTPGHPVGTGAVDAPAGPVTTEFGPLGQEPTGAAANPEPVTVDGPYAKVIRAQGRRAAEPATATGQTKTQAPAADALPGVQPRAADTGH